MPLGLSRGTRLLAVVPHPDDESLALGGLLSRAASVGADFRIIYLTSGDNNPWPQRALERRWRIGAQDRVRWGQRRQAEALAALGLLGVPSEKVVFLGYPDQGLTRLLMQGDEAPVERLTEVLDAWRPTLLAAPCLSDIHPDHSAAAVFVRQAMAATRTENAPRWIEYLVHSRKGSFQPFQGLCLPLSQEQRNTKRAAISCHRTQTLLQKRKLFSFSRGDERFAPVSGNSEPHHPVLDFHWHDGILHLGLTPTPSPGACGPITLCIAGNRQGQASMRSAIRLPSFPGGKFVELMDSRNSERLGRARFYGNRRRATVVFEDVDLGHVDQLFAKVKRSFGFFDEAGWGALSVPDVLDAEIPAGLRVVGSP